MKTDIDRAIRLIDEAPDHLRIIGSGASSEVISMAERELGVTFPRDFARFLSLYGHGGVGGIEIYGLPSSTDDVEFSFPKLVELNLESWQDGMDRRILAFQAVGNGEVYGLDFTSDPTEPRVVVLWPWQMDDGADYDIVADNFGEHLRSQLERLLSGDM